MMKLYDLGNNKYRIVTTHFGLREGSLKDIVQFAVFDLHVDYIEIEAALVAMNALGHDGAEFGVYLKFIYSFSTKEKSNVSKAG